MQQAALRHRAKVCTKVGAMHTQWHQGESKAQRAQGKGASPDQLSLYDRPLCLEHVQRAVRMLQQVAKLAPSQVARYRARLLAQPLLLLTADECTGQRRREDSSPRYVVTRLCGAACCCLSERE